MPFAISHVGPIDDKFVSGIQNIIYSSAAKIDALQLNISSPGGSVISGITAYNFLKQLPFSVHTHNLGEVSSAAILPFLAGTTRSSEHYAKFILHPIEISIASSMPYFKVEELLFNIARDIDVYASIVQKEAPELSRQYNIVELLKHQSLICSTDDAKALGLINT